MTANEKLVYTPKEVKDILGIGFNKIYELLATRKIKSFRIGKSIKIPAFALYEYIANSVDE